jgi:hypothetical protein
MIEIFKLQKNIHKMLKKIRFKFDLIHINVSHSFMARSRCKACGKEPSYYFAMRSPFRYNGPNDMLKDSEKIRNLTKKIVSDWFIDLQPRIFKNISEFNYRIELKQFTPTLFRRKGFPIKDRDNVIEMVGCNCGAIYWSFNDRSNINHPEVFNRKGKYSFPKKFEY